jgi:putative transcriptional regulator
MKKMMLEELLAGMKHASQVARGPRAPSRVLRINAASVKQMRGWTKLSQPAFARLLGVELSTLRNWEQGRREPTGPAQALLRAIHNDPENVIRALERGGRRPVPAPLRRREMAA